MSDAASDRAEWAAGIERASTEAGGLWNLQLIRPQHGLPLLMAAATGDAHAANLLNSMVQLAKQIRTAPKHKPALCLSCPRHIRKCEGVTFIITAPDNDRYTSSIGSALFPRCASDPDGGGSKAIEGVRRLIPDARPITITDPESGHT